LSRRTRVALVALALLLAAAGAIVALVIVVLETSWGHERIRGLIVSTISDRLAPGATLTLGRITGGIGDAWSAESVVLRDSTGRTVAQIGRVSGGLSLPSLLRGRVRLGVVVIDSADLLVEKYATGRWNIDALLAAKPPALEPVAAGASRLVVADSVQIHRSRIVVSTPDTGRGRPNVRREYSRIELAAGATTLAGPDGGHAPLRALALTINNPPVRLVSASGDVRWWGDSLRLDVPRLRLPGSRASLIGTVAWGSNRPTQLALDILSDSISVTDVRWMSKLFPSEGTATARVAIRTEANGAFRYDVEAFDLRAFASHLTGRVSVIPGIRTEMRNLDLAMAPFDLALVRNVFGDTILAPGWRGALDGRVVASGGFLDSLVIDSVRATFSDARLGGAQSRLRAHGAMDVASVTTRLMGFRVDVDSMDVRTAGVVARAADSLSGALVGHLTLNGPTKNVLFSDLVVRHIDGDRQASVARGSGRIASDNNTRWLDAELTLDTIAIATLAGHKSVVPLRSTTSGTLTLSAQADTMWIDARIRGGDGSVRITGTSLLDTLRTRLDLAGTMTEIDPGVFIGRKEIPALSLSGTLKLAMDDSATRFDRHLEVRLDTTSLVGTTKLQTAVLRFGYDSTGFHLDTASLRAIGWAVEARGSLALTGVGGNDSVTFSATIDSLATLQSLLLDSTGAPRFTELGGSLNTREGVLRGSFESATLRTLVGGTAIRVGTTTIGSFVGDVTLDSLPDRGTGLVRGSLVNVVSGTSRIDSASVAVQFDRGERARGRARIAIGDTVDVSAIADVTWKGDAYAVRLDSLVAELSGNRWTLAQPAQLQVSAASTSVDSLLIRSDRNGMLVAAGTIANRGPIDARMEVRNLGLGEIAFLGFLPADIAGRINAAARVTGTRDAPQMTATATVDSLHSGEHDRPAFKFDATYASRRATLALIGTMAGRNVVDIRGDVPLDLSLRTVEDRIIDAPMSLRVRADSVPLADFEGIAPRVTGLAGRLDVAMDVQGTLRRPRGRGTLTIAKGGFTIQRYGIEGRDLEADIVLAGDSVTVRKFRVADNTDSPRDTAAISGLVRLAGNRWSEWTLDLHSTASRFRVINDPRLATAEATWQLDVDGVLGEPRVSGNVFLPYAVFTIGPSRRRRAAPAVDSIARLGIPTVNGVIVSFGSDVRLKSREANVQLAGALELFGPLDRPWISGSVNATRGTYRVDLGPIKRTFRVDSGVVVLEGTPDVPAALDIYTSYVVRRSDDDVTIGARLFGTTDRPRLTLTSNLGSATSQSEIVSYLVFGQSTFGLPQSRSSAQQTAQAALVPSLGGLLEGVLGTVLPFFQTLQVSTVANEGATNLISNPIDVLNSFAVTGGRQVGSDSFFSLSGGVCRGTRVSSTGNVPFWLGTAAEYRPRRSIGAQLSIDPGPAPCSRVGSFGDTYQFGLDLTYDWRFGRR
jgi:hypothetical protein